MATMTEEVLQGVNRKEMRAWERLYGAYYAALCSYARELVGNRDVAEDVVQETLVRVWEGRQEFPGVRDLTWYLYRAVYNNALCYLRTKSRRESALQEMEVEEVEEAEMPEVQFERTVQEELIRQLYVYIEELPEGQRRVILLSLQGCSGEEIAEKLGVSIHTVKTQKSRTFKYLRERLRGSVLLFLL